MFQKTYRRQPPSDGPDSFQHFNSLSSPPAALHRLPPSIVKCIAFLPPQFSSSLMLSLTLGVLMGSLREQNPEGSIWISYFLSSRFQQRYLKGRFPPVKRNCQNVISPKGAAIADSEWGPIVFTYVLLLWVFVQERTLMFQKHEVLSVF